jgi:alginate O-acetyltransferase complex protein AlgF
MRFTTAAVLLAAALAFAPAAPAPAAGRSVYGPETPGDSAFVRVVHAIPGSPALEPELGSTRFGALSYAQATAYRPVAPDIYQFSAGSLEQELIPASGRYYTIALLPDAVVVLEDPAHTDPARAQVFLYNFSTLPRVDLATADGKTTVVAGVAPRAFGMVVVNAVSARLAVRSAGSPLKPVGDLGLARGSSFSVFVLGSASSPSVFTLRAAVQAE